VKSLLEDKAGVLTSDAPNNRLSTLLKLGIKQMKPFLHKPHVGKAALVFTIQFGGLWGLALDMSKHFPNIISVCV
jgi:hypothetical protein